MARRDLMGDDDKPTKKKPAKADEGDDTLDLRVALRGVTANWFAAVFRMDNVTVKKKLATCPEIGRGKGNVPLFDVSQAVAYLVKPKVKIADWVKQLRPADLPPYLQSEFWDAQRKRQQFEENAGDLWRTDKVIELYGDTFKLIKESMNLWVDNIERNSGVTGEQRKLLIQLVDGLQDDIHKRLLELKKLQKTRNTASELEDIEKEAEEAELDKIARRYIDV